MLQVPVLAIHGGAGTINREALSAEAEREYRGALQSILEKGRDALAAGASALDAVTLAVSMLEDCPLFNAGRGAVYTSAETHELDAAIMDGSTLRTGALSCVHGVKNPIRAARVIMEQSPHVLMTSDGAMAFLRGHGVEFMPDAYFDTEHRLAAATSTGGMTNTLPGRVGDTPIVGAGCYADDGVAVSCTGSGEYFIRLVVGHDVAARMRYLGESLEDAAHAVLSRVGELGGTGGLIAVDNAGHAALPFISEGMYRGCVRGTDAPLVAIYGKEEGC